MNSVISKLWPESLRTKSSVAIIVTVAVLLEIIFIVEYVFARRGIREEVEHRAETELRVKNLEIQKVMVAVETAISNTVWSAEHSLDEPDSLYAVLRRMVEQNPTIVGAALLFEANYYPQKGLWFEPYVAERADGSIEEVQIGGPTHNYLEADFYLNGLKAGKGCWRLRLRYALIKDTTEGLKFVDNVPNGLKCNCVCPHCGKELVARNNPKNKREHHFAHRGGADCKGARMTTLHKLAQEVIAAETKVMLPLLRHTAFVLSISSCSDPP